MTNIENFDNKVNSLSQLTIEKLVEIVKVDSNNHLSNEVITFNHNIDLQRFEHIFTHPCKLDAITVIFCMKGKMKVKVNLKEVEITEGMIFTNLPQNIIQIDYSEDFQAKGFIASAHYMKVLNADANMLIPLYKYFQMNNTFLLEQDQNKQIYRLMDALFDIVKEKETPYKYEIGRCIITTLCYKVNEAIYLSHKLDVDPNGGNKRATIYEQFMRLLIENHNTERNVSFYAAKLDLSPKYFSKLIQDFSGRSAAQWIDEYVILEAKALLRYSRMTIQQITEHLNFSTQSFFGRYFKHHTGMSPGEYRKRG